MRNLGQLIHGNDWKRKNWQQCNAEGLEKMEARTGTSAEEIDAKLVATGRKPVWEDVRRAAGRDPIQHVPQAPVVGVQAKSVGVAYVLWLLLGVVGGHQLYLGNIKRGVFYLCTLGGLGILTLVDLFTLGGQVRRVNAQMGMTGSQR